MSRWTRSSKVRLAAEAARAFLASVAFFGLAAAAIPLRGELVLILILGALSQRRAEGSEQARGLLVQEQAALRRVATLVARGQRPEAVFAAVAEEVGVLLDVDGARVVRYVGDDEIMQLEGWTAPGHD